jgi:hypothetical protein
MFLASRRAGSSVADRLSLAGCGEVALSLGLFCQYRHSTRLIG